MFRRRLTPKGSAVHDAGHAKTQRNKGNALVDQERKQPESENKNELGKEPAANGPLVEEIPGGLVTRREFVIAVGAATGAAVLGVPFLTDETTAAALVGDHPAGRMVPVRLQINGATHELSLDPRVTLLDLLRENLAMTGTKKGCDHGQCGACTVLANGRRINSCLSLAVVHDGEQIVTIEGLSQNEELHPLQTAFLEHDGFQCGYCTPGQLCSAVAMLEEARVGAASYVTADLANRGPANLSAEEIRERMSGNICRCGAYPGIVQAIQSVYAKS
jgi:xanthine dehydrogenase YagT iron-sulfur-binding subunit